MDGSEEHQGSHLPQEQEFGAAFARMFMARNSAPQFEVSFVQYYHTHTGSFCLVLPHTDWLILFQISLFQNESVNSLFCSFVSRLV